MVEAQGVPAAVGADDELRLAREQELTIEIVGGRLVVSIGIDALMVAALGGDGWHDDEFVITDPDTFAASIARGLEDEEEDGTTGIHLAIDKAVSWAIEMGEPGLDLVRDREVDDGA